MSFLLGFLQSFMKMTFLKQDNRLKKKEIIRKNSEINELFKNGTSFRQFPIISYYHIINNNEGENPVKVLISVPKKHIKKAVIRNLIKRRIKEAYRQNKSELIEFCKNNNINLNIAIIYSNNNIDDYVIIKEKIVLSLQIVITRLNKKANENEN